MLDSKKAGQVIAALRKESGYTQEDLSSLLCISPQAISRWENGHTLPETALLPMLAQIFGCSIDEILLPAYTPDERIESRNSFSPTGNLTQYHRPAFSDAVILKAVTKAKGNMGHCSTQRGDATAIEGAVISPITVSAGQRQFQLIEKCYEHDDTELHRYDFLRQYLNSIPDVYHIDHTGNIILMEDLSHSHIQGYDYDADNDRGAVFRENLPAILNVVAQWHIAFWENERAFGEIGLDWRFTSKECVLAHIHMLESDFETYRRNEEAGKIPDVWHTLENHMELDQLKYFETAIEILKKEYISLTEARFHTGKNITVIHGDLHPGTINLAENGSGVKFTGLQAVRMGLGTEDLAMLLALHVAPDKSQAMPLLDHYFSVLSGTAKDYSYDMFLYDYKLSILENMFFPIRLINRGIFDFHMRDKAIRSFETFWLT